MSEYSLTEGCVICEAPLSESSSLFCCECKQLLEQTLEEDDIINEHNDCDEEDVVE